MNPINNILDYINYMKEYGKEYITINNLIIFGLILYISLLSIYTPRHIISLINQPLSKLLILSFILYIGNNNISLAVFITIAFLVTVNLENIIQLSENNFNNVRENFTELSNNKELTIPKNSDIFNHNTSNVVNNNNNNNKDSTGDSDEDSDSDEYSDEDSDNDEDSDEDSDSDNDSDNNNDSDNDSDNDSNDEKFLPSINFNKVKPAKNLDDSFKKIHTAIHELEHFLSKK